MKSNDQTFVFVPFALLWMTWITSLNIFSCNVSSGNDEDTSSHGGSDSDSDSDSESDGGSDADGDSDSDSDIEQDAGYENNGICGISGRGIVKDVLFQGTEERYLIADEGYGADICRISYTLRVIGAPRTDCSLCEWAFDLEINDDVLVVAEEQTGCAGSSLGFDEATIAGLPGELVSYGYVDEYMGHSSVLMQYRNDQWEAVTFASWNSDTGEINYDRKDGTCGY